MKRPIVECIPNFSEGRHSEVVDEIVAAVSSVRGVKLLDRNSDHDHNRSVLTFAGPPEDVLEAAYRAIARAADLIDMEAHEGEHPRLGATDVVPFVPIQDIQMETCVQLAKRLGERVGTELEIPVYLYEQAATRPDRVRLEDIRRGEYEHLREVISADASKRPDFGPSALGSAGATVIGARPPLIAFNVYLASEDVSIAKAIARAVRHSSGGLRYVKALGLSVDGQAQISMNLTDYTRTPVARVVEFIRREALRYGVALQRSELVGLIPQAAMLDAAAWYTQLDDFSPEQVLETRLFTSEGDEGAPAPFLEELAAGTAAPGGGSASAYAGAMAAALVGMVARLTVGKKKYAALEARMGEILEQADALRAGLEKAVELDAQAFSGVMQAYRLPKSNESEHAVRAEAIETALHQAAAVPLSVARDAVAVLRLAGEVARDGNLNAVSDAGSAGALAVAAINGAAMNVRINASSASDQAAANEWRAEVAALEGEVEPLQVELNKHIQTRAGL